jgi:septal ring factor EnvC (AmiA/AmiB activator)
MDITLLLEMIATVGFPIVACIALGWFIYKIYKASEKREELLRKEIKENQETNRKAIETIAKYATSLDSIQTDIQTIKDDIIIISEKIS